MRCSPALLLSLCLVAALARAQDDSQFCSAVNEDDPSGEWQWISNISDTQDSFMDVPEDVLNATIQYFDEQYVPGVGTAGEARPVNERWVPCSEDDRTAGAVGCLKADAEGDVYSLRITITCNHIDHQDKAVVYATVAVPAGGGEVNVTLSDVELDVDESHLELPACTTPFCKECSPVVGQEGEEPEPETCQACFDGYELAEDGECHRVGSGESPAARKMLQKKQCVPDDKSCPCGEYLYTGTYQGGCGPCTRPGCAKGTINKAGTLTDCVWCWGYQGNCPQSGPGKNQWCRSCSVNYFWQDQGCYQCEDYIAFCNQCSPCNSGKACHNGAVCTQCQVGYKFRGDGYGYCVRA